MKLQRLDHVHIRTPNLADLAAWYVRILGLKTGYRPEFSNSGYWLYMGDLPIVHLAQGDQEQPEKAPKLGHFALRATGFKDFLTTLDVNHITYDLFKVTDINIIQVNIYDPEGNALHIDFPLEESIDIPTIHS